MKASSILLFILFSICLLSGCIAKGRIDISMISPIKKSVLNLNIATVRIQNDQLIINGSNLTGVTTIKLIEGGSEQVLTVESSTNNEIIANGIAAISLGVGKVFDMVLSNANAAATFPVSFTLNDGSVTAVKLAPMGALSGQVLKFNGTAWAPASLIDAQLYKGTWDPATLLPDVGLSSPGDYWVVSTAGTNAGDGITYAVGDWIISDGYDWSKLELSKTSVTSFNGRKGLVNLVPGDYPNLKSGAKIPGSNLNDLANVDITTVAPNTNDVLKFNGTNWVAGVGGGGASSVGSTEITDLSITGADIAENTINLSKLYSPSIDAALYLRGDKTWANFTAEVLNAPLSTYVLDATVKPTVMVTDKIGPALGKIQKYLNDLNTDYISKTATSQVVSGTFSFTSPTSFLYTQLPSGASPTEVSNVQYVQNYVGAALSGISSSAPVTLTTANGAATSGDSTLNVVSTSGYPSAGTLLVGSEAITYTGTTGTSFTGLTRGAYGTTAAAISNGATINNYLLLSKSTSGVTPKMVVTGAGNVGIGTTTPTSLLHVSNPAIGATRLSITNQGSAPNNANGVSGIDFYAFYSSPSYRQNAIESQVVSNSSNGAADLLFKGKTAATDSSLTEFMRIATGGNVGVGTTSPTALLHLTGSDTRIRQESTNAGIFSSWGGYNITDFRSSLYYGPSPGSASGNTFYVSPEASSAGDFTFAVPNGESRTIRFRDVNGAWSAADIIVSKSAGSNANGTMSFKTTGHAVEQLFLDAVGNVGIGTTAPSEKLHVVGNLRVQGSTDCTLGNGAGGTNCSSDIRLKENIQAIKDPLHKILSLRGVEFDWNEKSNSPGRHDIGVIAQDVEKVFPTAVFQDPNTGFKKVDYAVLVAPIIQAFKQINKFINELLKASEDHNRDIDFLKTENKILKAENKDIKAENKEIKAKLEKIEKLLEKIK